MNNRKQPASILRWMAIIAIAHIGLTAWDIHTTLHSLMPSKWPTPADLRQRVIDGNIRHGAMVLAGLVTEAAIYWLLRKKATHYGFAKVHVGSLAVALIALPVVMNTTIWSALYARIELETSGLLYQAAMKLYWITLGLGQLFFAGFIIELFRRKKGEQEAVATGRSVRAFTTPVWWLGGLLVIVACMLEYWIAADDNLFVGRLTVMAVLLVLESLLYYRLRNWIEKKRAAMAHVVLLYVAWMVVPVVLPLVLIQMDSHMQRETYETIRISLLWGLTIAAHIFFFIACRGAGKRRKAAAMLVGAKG